MHCISQTDGRTYSYWNIKSYALRPFHIQLCSFGTFTILHFTRPYREWKQIVLEQSTALCFINWAFVQPQKPQALVFYKILRTEKKHNTSFPYPTLSSVSWLKLYKHRYSSILAFQIQGTLYIHIHLEAFRYIWPYSPKSWPSNQWIKVNATKLWHSLPSSLFLPAFHPTPCRKGLEACG